MREINLAKFVKGILALCLWLVGLQNCSLNSRQTKTLGDFSSQTVTVAKVGSKELVNMRQGVIAMNLSRIQMSGQQDGMPWYDDLDEKFDVRVVAIRLKALNTLLAYGSLLQALADTNPEKGINQATDRFIKQVKGLPKIQRSINDAQLSALAKAIQIIGINYMEERKKKAIRSILEISKPQIDFLCDKLADEFDHRKDGKLASQYLLTINNLFFTADDFYFDNKDQTKKEQALQAIQLANFHKERKNNYLLQISGAIHNLKKANAMLYKAFTQDSFDAKSLDDLVRNVQSLQEIQQILQK
ncbi:MAG: hypothetical protein AAF518_22330 [Spirochaetota bacterium]